MYCLNHRSKMHQGYNLFAHYCGVDNNFCALHSNTLYYLIGITKFVR